MAPVEFELWTSYVIAAVPGLTFQVRFITVLLEAIAVKFVGRVVTKVVAYSELNSRYLAHLYTTLK